MGIRKLGGDPALKGFFVQLRSQPVQIAEAMSEPPDIKLYRTSQPADQNGDFEIDAPPGLYELAFNPECLDGGWKTLPGRENRYFVGGWLTR